MHRFDAPFCYSFTHSKFPNGTFTDMAQIPSPRGSGFSAGRRRSLARKFERDGGKCFQLKVQTTNLKVKWKNPVRTRIIQDGVRVGADF